MGKGGGLRIASIDALTCEYRDTSLLCAAVIDRCRPARLAAIEAANRQKLRHITYQMMRWRTLPHPFRRASPHEALDIHLAQSDRGIVFLCCGNLGEDVLITDCNAVWIDIGVTACDVEPRDHLVDVVRHI